MVFLFAENAVYISPWVALAVGLPATITALAGLIVSIRNGKVVNHIETQNDKVIEKTIEIHTLTNSQLSNVKAELELSNQKILSLEMLLNEVRKRLEIPKILTKRGARK